ncbi:MAG TPA: VWA domain-containing protein [Rhodanobacteraceae bacterium]|nr:VWA domain-containing protein [Rhodanobacteraceae bacterium]
MVDFSFAWPWLWLVLPLPWLLRLAVPRAAAGAALRLPHHGVPVAGVGLRTLAGPRSVLLVLAWVALVAAAARPQHVGPPQSLQRSGRAMMLAVDLSGSMSIEDMQLGGRQVSRFTAVRAIAGDFIARRDGDQVGLVLFGSRAYLMTPLTFDLTTVRKQLDGAAVGLAGRETAIGDAIAVAVKRLQDLPAQARVLVLLTDGVNNAGAITPDTAAAIAKAAGVRIYTIGVGAEHLRVQDFFGSHVVNPSASLDVGMLTHIASSTGGRFYRATDTQALAEAYRAIDALEPVADKQTMLRPVTELFRWPLGLACLLAALLLPWRALRLRRSAPA